MVKFLLLVLGFVLACVEGISIRPEEVNGDWRSLYVASDNPNKVKIGGPLRAYVHEIHCEDTCDKVVISFDVKTNENCQYVTVVGELQENGVYTTDYSGKNFFKVIGKNEDAIAFLNVNVDDDDKRTKSILVVGKGNDLTEEEKEKLVRLAEENDIPPSSIEYLPYTDDCSY